MPLYEYQCRDCGRRLEIIQKFSDDPLTECSECGGTLEKVLSAPAFHLKGSGWYKTDYAQKDGGKKKTRRIPRQRNPEKQILPAKRKPKHHLKKTPTRASSQWRWRVTREHT